MSSIILFILTITVINCYASDYDDLTLKIKNRYDTIVSLEKNILRFNKFGSNANKTNTEFDDFLNKRDVTRNDAKDIFDKLSWRAMEIIPQTPAPKYKKGFQFNIGKISIKEYDSEIKRTGFYENEIIFEILVEALKSKDIIFASYAYDQILEKSRYDFLLNNSPLIKDGLETFVRNIARYSSHIDKKQADEYYELNKLIQIKSIEDLELFYYLNLTNDEIKGAEAKIKNDKLLNSKYFNVDQTILDYNNTKDFETKSILLQIVSFVNNEQTFKALVFSLGSDLFKCRFEMPAKTSSWKTIQNKTDSSVKDNIEKSPSLEQTDEQYWMFRCKVFEEIVRSGREFCNRDKLKFIRLGVNRGASREEQQAIFDEIVSCVKSKYNLEIKINPENKKNVFTNFVARRFN